MKINEVITEAGLLGKIGRGLGAAAIAPIRALDIIGGGSGNVGTKSQIAARQQAATEKANRVAVTKAYDQFAQTLAPQGVKLNDPRTYNQSMKDMLQAFAVHYYGSDYTTGPVIQQELNKIPVPTTLNPGAIRDYLNKTGEVYVDVNNNMLSYKLAQAREQQAAKLQAQQDQERKAQAEKEKAAAEKQAAGPQLAPGVTAVSVDPVILRYGKKDYYIADDGMWHEMNNRNPVDDAWQRFFDQQAELVEPQRQIVQTPASTPAPVVKPNRTAPATPAAKAAPTPEQVRQQKQAAATQQIQRQLKPKIQVRPGETLDQAIARTRASRA
jgi:hypothetical protein